MSTAVGICIITILSFFIVWIGFPAENPKESFKDALEFSGGLFGGLTTFGAAIVAAHLYTDWREQLTTTVRQEHAKSTQLAINKILLELDNYGTFVLMHTGMGHEPEYMKQATSKVNVLIKQYPNLAFDLQINLLSYQETFLNGASILTDQEELQLTWWYYYSITNVLSRIIKNEHLNEIDNFQKYIDALKRDREIFQKLRKKINDEMIPKINIK